MQLNAHANEVYRLTDVNIARAKALANRGFSSMDVLHLACAESCGANVFLTTDDKLIHSASRSAKQHHVVVENPLHWLVRQQESEP